MITAIRPKGLLHGHSGGVSPFAARVSVFYFTGGESIEQEKSQPERCSVCQGL
nr:MAG TPA: hypothetical protein [Caudoviricetes sp.]